MENIAKIEDLIEKGTGEINSGEISRELNIDERVVRFYFNKLINENYIMELYTSKDGMVVIKL